MASKSRMRRTSFCFFIILCAAVLTVQAFGLLDSSDWRLQVGHYQKGGLVSPEIYVIGIDEETMEAYGSWQSWSRRGTAALLEALGQDPLTAPAVIGLDIGFFGEGTEEDDQALAEAAARAGNVVVTSYASFGREVEEGEGGTFSSKDAVATYEVPYDGLRPHVAYGFSNVPVDRDGIVRHSLYSLSLGEGQTAYSFATEIYRRYTGSLPEPVAEGVTSGYIPFAGQPFEFYGSETAGLSFSKVVSGEIPPELFAGSIVLVGPYTTGMMDAYYTAVRHDMPMYGVEIHANILQAFLDGEQKKEAGLFWRLSATAAMMGLVLAAVLLLPLQYAAAAAAVLLLLYWAGSEKAYELGCILPLVYPLSGSALLFAGHILMRYLGERQEKKRLEKIFGRYVSKEVASSIVKGGEDALKLGGQKRDVAVLFVDIRDFTPMSEALPPETVVEILNRYLELTTRAVFANKGTVDKFIGDATMAIYNAPLDLEDYVFRAVKTGLDMRAAAEGLAKELAAVTDRKIGFGVGIDCGEVVVGNIGTSLRMDYTAIGSTVNTAARLEAQAKAGEVVVSQAVYDRLKGRIRAECLGRQKLKGIAEETCIYQVVGVIDEE